MDSFLPILALLFFWRTAVAIPVAFVLAIAFAALHGSRAATAWRLYLSRSTPGCCGTAQRVRVAESGPPQRQSNCLRQCLPSIWSFWVRLLKLGQVPPPVLWLRERSHWSLKQRQLACTTHACEGAPSHRGHLHTQLLRYCSDLGHDTNAVLRTIGLSDAQIGGLKQRGGGYLIHFVTSLFPTTQECIND